MGKHARTTAFYAPPSHVHHGLVELPSEEARHAIRVLRHRPGDMLVVVDGEGNWYRVRVLEVGKDTLQAAIVEHRKEVGEPRYHLTLGLALLKHMARFEWALEKAVELGVREIVPLYTHRTERQTFKRARLQRVLIAAMKQCGRSRLPRLREPVSLEEVLRTQVEGERYMAHEQAGQGLLPRLQQARKSECVHVLIGPEGGFTEEEVVQARAHQWELIRLGYRRLRAETAAIVAAAGFMLYHEDGSSYELDRENT